MRRIIYILLCSILVLTGSCKEKKKPDPTVKTKTKTTTTTTDSLVVMDDRSLFLQKKEKILDTFVLDNDDTLYFTLKAIADPSDTLTLSQKYMSVTGKKVTEIVHTINYQWKFQIKKGHEQILTTTFSKFDFVDTSDYSDLTYWFSNLNFLGYSSIHQLFLFDYWFAPDGSDYGAVKTFMVNMNGEIAFIEYSGVKASCSCDVPASFSSDGKYVLMCEQLVDLSDQFKGKPFPEKVADIADMGWINNELFWVLFDTDIIEHEVNNLRIYDLTPRGYEMCSFNGFYCELGYSTNAYNDSNLPFVHLYDHTNNQVILLRRDKKPVVEKLDLEDFDINDHLTKDSEGVWVYYFENTCMVWFYNKEKNQLEYNKIVMGQ